MEKNTPRQVKMRQVFLSIVTLFILLMIGCASPYGTSTNRTPSSTWPTENYYDKFDCDKSFTMLMVITPMCTSTWGEKNFDSNDEFQDCRVSVANFINAIDRWIDCRGKYLSKVSTELQISVDNYLACIDSGIDCGPYTPPKSLKDSNSFHDLSFLSLDFPWYTGCREDYGLCTLSGQAYVEDFQKKIMETYRNDVAEAQNKQREVIDNFNNKARSQTN